MFDQWQGAPSAVGRSKTNIIWQVELVDQYSSTFATSVVLDDALVNPFSSMIDGEHFSEYAHLWCSSVPWMDLKYRPSLDSSTLIRTQKVSIRSPMTIPHIAGIQGKKTTFSTTSWCKDIRHEHYRHRCKQWSLSNSKSTNNRVAHRVADSWLSTPYSQALSNTANHY